MAKQSLNIGTTADDGTGTTIRAGGDLINDNFNEIYSKLGDGTTLHDLTFPNATDTVVGRDTTDTLTNKTISGGSNTISNIGNSSLTNSAITINGSSVSLGGSTTISTNLTIVDDSSTSATITSGSDTLSVLGGSNLSSTISGDTLTIALNSSVTGLTSLQTETLTNASGNLLVDSATYITEFRGDGSSTRGQIQLNCEVNTHGQKIVPQPHSEGVTNTLTLPAGADQELVGTIDTQTLTNKTIDASNNTLSNIGNSSLSNSTITIADDSSTTTTIGLGETLKIAGSGITTSISGDTITLTGATLSYSKGTAIGDGSTTAFTINSGRAVDDILVYVNGICLVPTDDYTISGTTLTFATAPAASAEITFRYLPI